jgi:hypothetical protein
MGKCNLVGSETLLEASEMLLVEASTRIPIFGVPMDG